MQEDIARQIEEAAVPAEQKAALVEIVEWIAQLPDLPLEMRYRLGFARRRLLAEAIAPAASTLFWEVALDFVTKAAREHGPAGQSILDAAGRLAPLLRAGDTLRRSLLRRDLRKVSPGPSGTFAPNAISLAQAHFHPHAGFVSTGEMEEGELVLVRALA